MTDKANNKQHSPADGDSVGTQWAPSATNGNGTDRGPVECQHCGTEADAGANQCPECGRWLPRNEAALVHGRRRYQETGLLPPELHDFIQELRDDVTADLGGEGELSRIQLALVDRLVELEASARLMLDFALRTGADTKRGRQSLGDHQRATDSQLRVAKTLGLKRTPKPVPTLDEVMAGD